ncbi:MAG TPA: four helix bundle protein, partial [Thermoanaerobaculia bacterium]
MHRYYYRQEPSLRSLGSQAMRAAGSIGANLEEADAAQSTPDFISKCNIALKEARETRYWLRI